jgi:hypothetical protein
MVRVSILDDTAVFEVQGFHKVWALKHRLKIPLAHIKKVLIDPDIVTGLWQRVRTPGRRLPGLLIAGTFYNAGKCSFWDVRNKQNAIVVELAGESYHQLIIEVKDPSAEVERLQAATFQDIVGDSKVA